ncbi:MAG TPA: carboxypeptidase regulatory-like domain-containing protein [Candidatus Acidoferrales bacterium]|nr:carboxypeptidase regulatory-like domain-containing protein [Candidatus Acidoferrales bacterium]
MTSNRTWSMRKVIFAAVLLFLCGLFAAANRPANAAENASGVEGVVQDASGKPVAGAFVKLKNNERHLEFMVISQAQGRYAASNLPAGQYVVQGVGGGYQSAVSAPVDVAEGKTAKLDLSLAAKQGPMLPRAWPMKTPEALMVTVSKELPEGDGKKLVATRCTTCHDTERFVGFHMPRDRWEFTVRRMRARMRTLKIRDLTEEEAKLAIDYLSADFAPVRQTDLNDRLPRTLLEGKALHYRAVQYDISDTNVGTEPHDVAVDPNGNGWVSQRYGKLGRLDGKTLEFTEVSIPPGPASDSGQLIGNLQISPKGELWVPDGPNYRWLDYDINAKKFTAYDWPKDVRADAGGNSMLIHPNGSIWETSGNQVRMLNTATKEFKFLDTPSYTATQIPNGAYGITVAGDGSVWWAEDMADRMVRVDPATGKMEEYKIPFDGIAYPRRMSHDARGDIWVGLWNAGLLMKVDYETKQMAFYAPPTETPGTYSVSVDRKNNLIWVSEQQADKIARFNPKTSEWVEFPLPDSESDPRRIEVDPTNPNRVWWSGNLSGRMGFVEVLGGN